LEVLAFFVADLALAVAACESAALVAAVCWAAEALAEVVADFLAEEEALEGAMEQPGKAIQVCLSVDQLAPVV